MSELSTSDRPTFEQAFASDASAADSQAATPSTETPTTETPTAAIAQPVDGATGEAVATPDATQAQGEPPQERWPTILENAREKARAEAKAEFQQQYGWAQQVDRGAIEEAQRIGQLYQQDRHGYIRQVLSEAISDPDLAPLVRSEAARVLGSRAVQQAAPPPIEPGIPVMNERGELVARTYTHEQIDSLVAAKVSELIGKEVGPIKQDFAARQQEQQAAAERRQLTDAVKGIYETATSELPHFKEHEAEIAKAMESIQGDPAQALHRAWAKVVLPKLEAMSQAKQLESMKTKAAASTVNPAAAVVASTNRPKSLNDPSLKW